MLQTPLRQRIHTLPTLFADVSVPFQHAVSETFKAIKEQSFRHVYLVGCGDSYHACVGAVLAFHQITGVPTQAVSSLHFSRYTVGYLSQTQPEKELVIIVSVSGIVSRSIEAAMLAQRAGATVIVISGDNDSPMAHIAQNVLAVHLPPLKEEPGGAVVPGTRSFIGSQLALYYMAVYLGETSKNIPSRVAQSLRKELQELGSTVKEAIQTSEKVARQLVRHWQSASEFIYVGAGPLLGTAMLSAAKMLESSGDSASAQETEEWTHLEYFISQPNVPTLFLTAGERDLDRMQEAVAAAQAIGRRIAVIAPKTETSLNEVAEFVFPLGEVRECFSPLVYCIPGMIIADERGASLGESYFRNFGRGRTVDWADGPSRLRDSHLLDSIPADEVTGRDSNLKPLQPIQIQKENDPALYPVVKEYLEHLYANTINQDQRQLLTQLTNIHLDPKERLEAGNQLAKTGDPRPGIGVTETHIPDIDWVNIPAGKVLYQNREEVLLPAFSISRFPITYAQFQAFVDASDGFSNPRWWKGLLQHVIPGEQVWRIANRPRERVSWYDAVAFTRWLSQKTKREIRLPQETEFERAAKGAQKLAYPWGGHYQSGFANIDEKRSFVGPHYLEQTTPVGMYPQGASEFGVHDLCGNVWEWCLNHYDDPSNLRYEGDDPRVLKGGAYYYTHTDCHLRTRYLCDPSLRLRHRGFRIIRVE